MGLCFRGLPPWSSSPRGSALSLRVSEWRWGLCRPTRQPQNYRGPSTRWTIRLFRMVSAPPTTQGWAGSLRGKRGEGKLGGAFQPMVVLPGHACDVARIVRDTPLQKTHTREGSLGVPLPPPIDGEVNTSSLDGGESHHIVYHTYICCVSSNIVGLFCGSQTGNTPQRAATDGRRLTTCRPTQTPAPTQNPFLAPPRQPNPGGQRNRSCRSVHQVHHARQSREARRRLAGRTPERGQDPENTGREGAAPRAVRP